MALALRDMLMDMVPEALLVAFPAALEAAAAPDATGVPDGMVTLTPAAKQSLATAGAMARDKC